MTVPGRQIGLEDGRTGLYPISASLRSSAFNTDPSSLLASAVNEGSLLCSITVLVSSNNEEDSPSPFEGYSRARSRRRKNQSCPGIRKASCPGERGFGVSRGSGVPRPITGK